MFLCFNSQHIAQALAFRFSVHTCWLHDQEVEDVNICTWASENCFFSLTLLLASVEAFMLALGVGMQLSFSLASGAGL